MVLLFSIRVIFFFGQIGCSATGVSGKATEMPSEKMYKFRVRKWLCGGFCAYLTSKRKKVSKKQHQQARTASRTHEDSSI